METYIGPEEQIHKKGRHRKKQLFNSIMQQMEFYFSDSNISKDKFLYPLIEKDIYVDISVFLKFNKIRKLTTNIDDIVKAINNSQLLELSEDKTKVKRITPFYFKENVENCTLYVERLKVDATHDWLSSLFSEFGNVTYVSIPKYKHNKANKGFAFIEFEKEEEATKALNYFESIGCRMSSLMPPESLCSIITYDGKTGDETNIKNVSETVENDTQKKRKHSIEESEENKKKIKIDNVNANTSSNNNTDDVQIDFDDKRKKKHRKMRKRIFKELGLQVLSKGEWKHIRNRYLDNQKVKMMQLKQFLNKRKFSNHLESNKHKAQQQDESVDSKDKHIEEEKDSQKQPYVPGVIVKVQLLEPLCEPKEIKAELKQYSPELQYVDIPQPGGAEAYLRFTDAENAKHFTESVYKGQCAILEGDEEMQYWDKIKRDRSGKTKKNQKHVRGREKLLKRAEKELGKHIKFDDAD